MATKPATLPDRGAATWPEDPLLAALVILWRRLWVVALAAALGAGAAWLVAGRRAPHVAASAQLFIKVRPVYGGVRQDPLEAVAYADMVASPEMKAIVSKAAGGEVSLDATIRTTQDTNFGKYYSPLLPLELRAADETVAKRGLEAWRTSFLALYGDLASRDAKTAADRMEQQAGTLRGELDVAYRAEVAAEGAVRPLLLERAAVERLMAPFSLEIHEPLAAHPRSQVESRDRVIVQDIQVAGDAPRPTTAEGLELEPDVSGAYAVELFARTFGLVRAAAGGGTPNLDAAAELRADLDTAHADVSARLADRLAALRSAQSQRVALEGRVADLSRMIDLNRASALLVDLPAPITSADARLHETADLLWVEAGDSIRRVAPRVSRWTLLFGALAGAVLAALAVMLQYLSAHPPAASSRGSD